MATEDRRDGQAHQAGEFDENVHRRAGSVLERVAHGVAGNGGLVRVGAFVEHGSVDVHAFFKRLLGVIPGAAGVGLEDGPQHAAHRHAGHVAAERFGSHSETDDDGGDDRDEARRHHFAEGCFGGNFHTLAVFGFAGAFEQARNFAELAAHLVHHIHGGFSHALHGQSRKHNGDHAADEQGSQHVGFKNIDALDAREVHIGGKQAEGRQSRRGNGKTFADGGGGVAHGVEHVGFFTYVFRQFAHLCDTAGVVGDGAEGVNGQLHGRGGHHGGGSNSHPVKSGQCVSAPDGAGKQHDRHPGGHHARGEAGDHVGGMARA